MEQKMVKVEIMGEAREYPAGTTFAEIVEPYQKVSEAPVILVTVNGKLKELHKKLKYDSRIGFVTTKDNIGHQTYKRSACMILLKAIYDIAGKEQVDNVVIHYSVGSGYYFTMKGSKIPDQKFLDQVKARMHEIVEAKLPIEKRTVSTDEAIALFHKHRMYDKEQLFRYRRVSRVNLYRIDTFEDYFYGYMANHTGYIRYFDLKPYDEGFVLELPEREKPDVIPPFLPEEKIFRVQKESQEWVEKLNISCVGDLNDRITKEGIRNILLVQEALQEAKISNIARKICETGNKKFVMIAGPSSSGKTTFSHRLISSLLPMG